jgi:hypothetical protein
VAKAYNLNSLGQKQNKSKYREPDRLNSAKQELKKLVKEYYAGTHSKQIAPHLSLTENKSRSFQTFIQGIKNVVEMIGSSRFCVISLTYNMIDQSLCPLCLCGSFHSLASSTVS